MTQSNFNFSPGPSLLPEAVKKKAKQAMWDWYVSGISPMEVSHRSPKFVALVSENEQRIRSLYGIDESYLVVFMPGGATMQTYAWCANLLRTDECADFAITGHWSKIAYQEALRNNAKHHQAFAGEANGYTSISDCSTWKCSSMSRFLHFVDNETVHGIEFTTPPTATGKILISDMSSNILSRPCNISSYGLIYAGMQKNMGIAGLTLVVVKKELLSQYPSYAPSLLSYQYCYDKNNLPNTPPTISHYILSLYLDWFLELGGLSAADEQCKKKSAMLYQAIDNSNGFYKNSIEKPFRSRINVTFSTPTPELDAQFASFAKDCGIHFIKGHASHGGLRASIYNAMPEEGVEALIECMNKFKQRASL
ncbi:MAG: 3-phosphoserine/phosphohydroxythreonine transaminase [Methylacidiphilales bacterium]|nr:3-phosphoserine/phosphohydroxythreonine transaminase [Candidatus Methylacidiphilales bacterium]